MGLCVVGAVAASRRTRRASGSSCSLCRLRATYRSVSSLGHSRDHYQPISQPQIFVFCRRWWQLSTSVCSTPCLVHQTALVNTTGWAQMTGLLEDGGSTVASLPAGVWLGCESSSTSPISCFVSVSAFGWLWHSGKPRLWAAEHLISPSVGLKGTRMLCHLSIYLSIYHLSIYL